MTAGEVDGAAVGPLTGARVHSRSSAPPSSGLSVVLDSEPLRRRCDVELWLGSPSRSATSRRPAVEIAARPSGGSRRSSSSLLGLGLLNFDLNRIDSFFTFFSLISLPLSGFFSLFLRFGIEIVTFSFLCFFPKTIYSIDRLLIPML